ncbi:PWWP domain-containing protein 1-like isoform X1 [Rhododendron vialii]|uniref:PWWP domain-containing protein 1-like isoform X1 n=2 Tax=Rhododendron vialii TaxID=182163 RepID=UPI00265FC4E8|nr:PWWP domain-containing protein 1-like isoform X1 [Rhododendron vialii]
MISAMRDKGLELDRNSDSIPDVPLGKARVSADVGSDSDASGAEVGVLEELESNRAYDSDFGSRVSVAEGRVSVGGESERHRVLEGDERRDSDFRNDDLGRVVDDRRRGEKGRALESRWSRVGSDEFDTKEKGVGSRASVRKSNVSTFDDFVANGKGEVTGVGLSTSVGYGYEIGDMIWGKVKSHPWWPGVIYNESFASPSVRRTKSEGHVLVAFFGDSSYGWFEPEELIPFESNYSEKSRQTNSRTFVKAVEDAVDEVNRRSGLGLACRCRNPYNFRPGNAQGYYAVDLNDYETGAVYSVSQIRKARESFQPRDTVAFIKQLALIARDEVYTSIYFVKNKATALAYRKAVFEEFDETYAQAFGQQPVRPSRESLAAVAQPVRAPLSGPMVMAEALGKRRKNSTKPSKLKEHENKEKYLFKRRDEPSEVKIHQKGQGAFSRQVEGSAASMVEPPFTFAETSSWGQASNSSFDNGKGALLESKGGDGTMNLKHDRQRATTSGLDEDFHQPPSLPDTNDEGKRVSREIDPKLHGQDPRAHIVTGKKKAKLLKRPVGELGVEKSASGEKKKRKIEIGIKTSSDLGVEKSAPGEKKKKQKKKIEFGSETSSDLGVEKSAPGEEKKKKKQEMEFCVERSSDLMQNQSATGKSGTISSLLPDSIGKRSTFGMGDTDLKLPQLLGDLQALALNPFHGVDMSISPTVQKAFLKFRSIVYEKSFSPAETEANEVHASKSAAGSSGAFEVPSRGIKELPSPKHPKPLIRPDDPTKGGRKRGPSDRQEEMASKRMKKVEELKSLAVEKKAAQIPLEIHRDGKEAVAIRPPKLLKPDSIKKTTESPSKARVPTMLVMKFPPNTNLPSGSELKARLARFGPLDHSATRVFWQSFTCRVVFLYRADAEAAHKHLSGSNSLFGNVNVKSSIRTTGAMGPDSEGKAQREDAVEQKPPKPQPVVQLKSCLKKAAGEEAAGAVTTGGGSNGNGSSRGTPRVKFVLEGGESSGGGGGEQLIVGTNKNNYFNNTTSFADVGGKSSSSSSSSSHGMEFNTRNFQKGILPLPPATAKLPNTSNNMGYGEVEPRNTHNFSANMARAGPSPTNIDIAQQMLVPPTKIDIAQQMLGLLTKCNDLVTNVSSFLGYVPYHPL